MAKPLSPPADASPASGNAMPRPPYASPAGENAWHLLVRVQPGAKKTECAGENEGRLRIRLAAPAVENKANVALTAFVAKTLGIRPSKVSLVSGETSRQKRLLVSSAKEPDWDLLR